MNAQSRRVGAVLALFFFMTFAFWLPDAPLLMESLPPRHGPLEVVPLARLPGAGWLWARLPLYGLTLGALTAMYCLLLDRARALSRGLLALLWAAKLLYLLGDLRYLSGADLVHLSLTAVFLLCGGRLASLRSALLILSLIAVVNRMSMAWPELVQQAVGLRMNEALGLLLALEALAPLSWMLPQARPRQVGVALWLWCQLMSWVGLSLLWPASLAACAPMLVVGALLLVPMEHPLQEGFRPGLGESVSGAWLLGLLALNLWQGQSWWHLYELDASREIRADIVITRLDTQIRLNCFTPTARSWNPEVPTRVQAWSRVAGEVGFEARVSEPLRVQQTTLFSPWRYSHASSALLAAPLFYRSYARELVESYRPERLQIHVDVNGQRRYEYDERFSP